MRRLRISRAAAVSFGRFSNRHVDLGDSDFIVIHGPNESGKTTLSELIAWMLAGRHGLATDTLKYGVNHDKIGGTISGTFDGDAFSVSRTFKVRDTNIGRAPAESAPDITLGGRSIATTEWENLIAVTSPQDYALRYRVTDSEGFVSVKDLLESLSVGARLGLTPAGAMSRLETRAGRVISAPNGRNTATEVATIRHELDLARRDHAEALSASRLIDQHQERLADISEEINWVESSIATAQTEKNTLVAAGDLLAVRRDIETAEAALVSTDDVPEEFASAISNRARTESAIADIRAAEVAVRTAANAFDAARVALGVEESVARTVSIEPDTETAVNRLVSSLDSARATMSNAEAALLAARVSLDDRRAEFASIATDIGLTADEAMNLASRHVDEIAFNESITRWLDAAKNVIDTRVRVKPATDREAARRHDLRDAQDAWDELSLPVEPEVLHGSGAGIRVASERATSPGLVHLVAVAATIVGATLLDKWAGVAATLIGAAVLHGLSRRVSTVGPAPASSTGVGLREAAALIDARNQLAAATTSLTDAIGAHDTAVSAEDELGKAAIEALRHAGITACSGPEHAAALRRKRAALVSVREEIDALERSITTETARAEDARATISSAEAGLANIASSCGVPHFGAHLDHHGVARIRALVGSRETFQRAEAALSTAQTMLVEATSQPSLAHLSGDALASEMQRAVRTWDARRSIESSIDLLRQRISAAIDANPDLRALLDDPVLSESVVAAKSVATDGTIESLRAELTLLNQEAGAIKATVSGLEQRSDLPDINHRIAQAELRLKEATTRGVADWFARKVVSDIKDEYERDNQPALIRNAGDMVHRATRGLWRGLRVSEDGARLEVLWGESNVHPESSMSAGARQLLRLAVRIAVADAHGERHQVALPLICDDPVGFMDSDRCLEMLSLLAECSTRRQVIVMTHDERTVERAVTLGATAIDIDPH